MKFNRSCGFITVIILKLIVILSEAKSLPESGYDFFLFVQQWPGAYCDTSRGCCYPKSGKPVEDFTIHGLWPNFNNGSYPQFCDASNTFHKAKILDFIKRMQDDWPSLTCPSGDGFNFWSHEWNKHGTCSESVLNQQAFFQKSLDLKKKSNLLRHLKDAGIYPNNGFYKVKKVEAAIKSGLGVTPFLECNFDKKRNSQLYQVYLCVDKYASNFIECPVKPRARPCVSNIQFQSFSRSSNNMFDQ